MIPRNCRASSVAPQWVKDACEGRKLMRDGKDYVNNGNRYGRAHTLLEKAYNAAIHDPSTEALDLAKISLWSGITLNENKDIVPPRARNALAIKTYERGLAHARTIRGDINHVVLPVRASLYNSMGVAHHHQEIPANNNSWPDIPASSMYYYRKARDIIKAHPDLKRELARIGNKIKHNTANRVTMSGGGETNGFLGGNVV
jgi:hypothetical protein